jgi:hypothetical protein
MNHKEIQLITTNKSRGMNHKEIQLITTDISQMDEPQRDPADHNR